MNIIHPYDGHEVKFTAIYRHLLTDEEKRKALKAERRKISLLIPRVHEVDQHKLQRLYRLLGQEMKKYSYIYREEEEKKTKAQN